MQWTNIMDKTSQELRMLSSVTLNCQITKIVMNPGSQLSELKSVSQMSQVLGLSKNLKIFQKSENLKNLKNQQKLICLKILKTFINYIHFKYL